MMILCKISSDITPRRHSPPRHAPHLLAPQLNDCLVQTGSFESLFTEGNLSPLRLTAHRATAQLNEPTDKK